MNRRTIFKYAFAGIAAIALTLVVGWWQVDGPGASEQTELRPVSIPEMKFGLSDHEGEEVGPETLMGRATMVFFGFTYCPDVCPTTLADISGWLDDLGEDAEGMNVVFITVDPERDTIQAIAEYVSYFHPSIRGWTGTKGEIANAAAGFRVRYEKISTNGDDYTMNHNASVFLFNAEGQFTTMIDFHEPREFAVPKIRRALS